LFGGWNVQPNLPHTLGGDPTRHNGAPCRPPVLVIASGNPHKVAEITAMLDAVQLEVRRQPEGLEIEETGSTYLENARLKATEVARITGQWALADDSGLWVDALGGAPGVHSARYADSDAARIERLLHELAAAGAHSGSARSAAFTAALALANPEGRWCWRWRGSAPARSWRPRAAAAASATTRCSSCRKPA